jgi:hypothetical protein
LCQQLNFRDAQRVQLATLEQQLNQQLTHELAARSPNAGATDAAHQAVLREQSDVEQRMLNLEVQLPGPVPCRFGHDEPGTSIGATTPTP